MGRRTAEETLSRRSRTDSFAHRLVAPLPPYLWPATEPVRSLTDGSAGPGVEVRHDVLAGTGTAITPRWIISASHCFFTRPDAPVRDARIEFRVGNLDMRNGRAVHPMPGSRVPSPGGADATCTGEENTCQSNRLKRGKETLVGVFWGSYRTQWPPPRSPTSSAGSARSLAEPPEAVASSSTG